MIWERFLKQFWKKHTSQLSLSLGRNFLNLILQNKYLRLESTNTNRIQIYELINNFAKFDTIKEIIKIKTIEMRLQFKKIV